MMRVWIVVVGVIFFGCSLQNTPTVNTVSQFSKDTTAIHDYLKGNNIRAIKLYEGIWYIIDSTAIGLRPTFGDTVAVTYKMKLLADESVVDQAASPATFSLPQIILGIRNAIPFFARGAKGRIFIPSFYGYGNAPYGKVPANSNLIFDFKLTAVNDNQLKLDGATIDNYLKTHSLNATTDPTGLRYNIDSLGYGAQPLPTDSVRVTYTAKDFPSGKIVDQATSPKSYLLGEMNLAMQIALSNVPEGSKVTVYAPSTLSWLPGTIYDAPNYPIRTYNIWLYKVISN